MIGALTTSLTMPIRDTSASAVYCKALFAYFGIKVLTTWSIGADIAAFHKFSQPRSVISWIAFGPGAFGANHIHLFFSLLLLVVVVAIVVKPNYFLSAIVAWLAFNFYRITFQVANGSDQVMVSLLFFAVLLSASPRFKNEIAEIFQSGIYHAARLFGRLYVVSVYFISGVDKLGSDAWRSGDAIASISQLRFMVNPNLAMLIPESNGGRLALAWLVILFELSFTILVWFKPTRKWILVCGVIFHLTTAFILSLPDFAGVMIISYLIFFNDKDYEKFQSILKRGN